MLHFNQHLVFKLALAICTVKPITDMTFELIKKMTLLEEYDEEVADQSS
jgi:hypothetical protein